ncbi:M28 family peptidase [Falsigemmobacter intermedius]|nr:M28 family peptidase [Falsigemmobacter intermedius]
MNINTPSMPTDADRLVYWLDRICVFGGRRTGSSSEQQASAWLGEVLAAMGGRLSVQDDAWSGWRPKLASIEAGGAIFEACALLNAPGTPAQGLHAPVLDLGRGTPEDFATHAAQIPGRIILVAHERMFSATTVHRRVKYAEAVARGAAGMLVVGHQPGSPVAGSTGMEANEGIPAMGISPETAAALVTAGEATLHLAVETVPATARSHFLEFGPTDGPVVVLSAHIDGHDPAEAALDNASGCAILLTLAEEVARQSDLPVRLRFCFFNLEEWRLTGSRNHVATLDQTDRDQIIVNINLDSLGIAGPMTALTSDFPHLGPFLQQVFASVGEDLQIHLPFQANSDHANFAEAGIPAFRLLGGFDDPASSAMAILSGGDRRDIVSMPDLVRAKVAVHATMHASMALPPSSLR